MMAEKRAPMTAPAMVVLFARRDEAAVLRGDASDVDGDEAGVGVGSTEMTVGAPGVAAGGAVANAPMPVATYVGWGYADGQNLCVCELYRIYPTFGVPETSLADRSQSSKAVMDGGLMTLNIWVSLSGPQRSPEERTQPCPQHSATLVSYPDKNNTQLWNDASGAWEGKIELGTKAHVVYH
jgi:hypothetical protein